MNQPRPSEQREEEHEPKPDSPLDVVEDLQENLQDLQERLLRDTHAEVVALHREIDLLHQRLETIHAHQRVQRVIVHRHHWIAHFIHDLEYNPHTQYRVHIVAAWFWILNLIIVSFVQFVFHEQWDVIAVFYVAVVSLYANFATDYAGASAALAAMNSPPLPEIPTEPPHDR